MGVRRLDPLASYNLFQYFFGFATCTETLIAWKKYIEEKDEKIKAGYLKEHTDSVRGHLYDKKKGLINKDYIKIYGLKSFQKVIVFFPSDNLLGFTLEQDKGLFTEALEDNFILAGPKTLLSMINF